VEEEKKAIFELLEELKQVLAFRTSNKMALSK
jgi:hypothetical protein